MGISYHTASGPHVDGRPGSRIRTGSMGQCRIGPGGSASLVLALAAAVLLACVLLACGGGTPGARGPGRLLPPYTGHATELFDDGIEPAAVGFSLDPSESPQADTRVRERTQTGDAVVRARVRTVTSRVENEGRSWQLGLHVLERLAGSGPLEEDFTLAVLPTDPAAGIVRAFEARLIGQSFVVFVRAFSPVGAPPGDPGDLHFHMAPETPDELKAVESAVLLERLH
jgi:hypothetical protein